MKKVIFLLLCFCFTISGCGNTENFSEENKGDTQKEIETEKSNINYDDLVLNNVGDIYYKIPKELVENSEEFEGGILYNYKSSFIISWKTKGLLDGRKYFEIEENEKKAELQQCSSDAECQFMKFKFKEIDWESKKNTQEDFYKIYEKDAYKNSHFVNIGKEEFFCEYVAIGSYDTTYVFAVIEKEEDGAEVEKIYDTLLDTISVEKSSEEIFEEFKRKTFESAKKLDADASTSIMIDSFEESFPIVEQVKDFEEFSRLGEDIPGKFSVSSAYFCINFDAETTAGYTGTLCWNAIHSLVIQDGRFEEHMRSARECWEESGRILAQNESEENGNETMGQKNAVSKAKQYLEFSAFSYKGLIEQLEYEKFSHEESVYGADNCGADWNEQAAKKAKQYLDTSSFSRNGLIEQLEYEGFTNEQAIYGVEQNGY